MSHGSWNYIFVYKFSCNNIMLQLHLWHNCYNILFKVQHKLHTASGLALHATHPQRKIMGAWLRTSVQVPLHLANLLVGAEPFLHLAMDYRQMTNPRHDAVSPTLPRLFVAQSYLPPYVCLSASEYLVLQQLKCITGIKVCHQTISCFKIFKQWSSSHWIAYLYIYIYNIIL